MELQEVKLRVKKAVARLNKRDSKLMLYDISERAIAHQLANKLAYEFRSFEIDCEYNGNSTGMGDYKRKSIKNLNERLLTLKHHRGNKRRPLDELIDMQVFPDIIIHKRLNIDKNLLIIEVKKSTSSINEIDIDKEKMTIYTQRESNHSRCEFDFKFGLLIIIGCRDRYPNHQLIWYQNGSELVN